MRDFSKIYKEDLDIVGKKAVELGELARLGVPIPDGFVITTSFFKKFLEMTGISKDIERIKKISHPSLKDSIGKLYEPIQRKVMRTNIPHNLTSELHKFYRKLAGAFKEPSLNIFTSSKNKSISYTNIIGDANFLLKVKEIWASQTHNPVAIVVQENIKSKIKGKIITNAPLIDKKFAALAYKIQEYFYFPQEISYAIEKGKIYVTQVKPFTGIVDEKSKKIREVWKLRKILIKGIPVNPGIVTGSVKLINNQNFAAVKNSEIAVSKSLNKLSYNKMKKAKAALNAAKAIIIDAVLTSSYDRMVYRKNFRMPTIEGTKNATKILQNGNIITVNGTAGEIYSGGFI